MAFDPIQSPMVVHTTDNNEHRFLDLADVNAAGLVALIRPVGPPSIQRRDGVNFEGFPEQFAVGVQPAMVLDGPPPLIGHHITVVARLGGGRLAPWPFPLLNTEGRYLLLAQVASGGRLALGDFDAPKEHRKHGNLLTDPSPDEVSAMFLVETRKEALTEGPTPNIRFLVSALDACEAGSKDTARAVCYLLSLVAPREMTHRRSPLGTDTDENAAWISGAKPSRFYQSIMVPKARSLAASSTDPFIRSNLLALLTQWRVPGAAQNFMSSLGASVFRSEDAAEWDKQGPLLLMMDTQMGPIDRWRDLLPIALAAPSMTLRLWALRKMETPPLTEQARLVALFDLPGNPLTYEVLVNFSDWAKQPDKMPKWTSVNGFAAIEGQDALIAYWREYYAHIPPNEPALR